MHDDQRMEQTTSTALCLNPYSASEPVLLVPSEPLKLFRMPTGKDAVNKVAYRAGGTLDHHEFVVFVHDGILPKWRKDKSIPLVDVVARSSFFGGFQTGG